MAAPAGKTRRSNMSDLLGRTLSRLCERLSGRVLKPREKGYAEATAIRAKQEGPMPSAVAHCRTVEDVHTAIRAARDCDLDLSARSGGHDWAGRALCDGIVIDLRGTNSATVGPNRTAQVSGGALAVDVAAAMHPLGLAVVTGAVGAVGIAGLRSAAATVPRSAGSSPRSTIPLKRR
jgi:FAD/FMN-containing dehydrogenase